MTAQSLVPMTAQYLSHNDGSVFESKWRLMSLSHNNGSVFESQWRLKTLSQNDSLSLMTFCVQVTPLSFCTLIYQARWLVTAAFYKSIFFVNYKDT